MGVGFGVWGFWVSGFRAFLGLQELVDSGLWCAGPELWCRFCRVGDGVSCFQPAQDYTMPSVSLDDPRVYCCACLKLGSLQYDTKVATKIR